DVDDDAALREREAARVMPATADGDRKPVLTGEAHRLDHVVDVGAAAQHRWTGPDPGVEEHPRPLIRGIHGRDQRSAKVVTKRRQIRTHGSSLSVGPQLRKRWRSQATATAPPVVTVD